MAVVMLAKVLLTTDDIPAASSAAKYSLKLLERFADDSKNINIAAKAEYIALYHVAIRPLPPAVIANQIRDAHERSKDSGDIEWLCQSHNAHAHAHRQAHTHACTSALATVATRAGCRKSCAYACCSCSCTCACGCTARSSAPVGGPHFAVRAQSLKIKV
jgi:hypothetical protein